MKIYKALTVKVIALVGIMLTIAGCEDFLTRNHPTGVTDDKYWETMKECESALGQCKLWVTGGQSGTELGLMFLEGATDNMYFFGNFDQRIVQIGNGSLVVPTSTNSPSNWEVVLNTWINNYTYIRRCCRFLEHVDNAYFVDESERTRMKAEARVWRAWYHIRLLNYYGRQDGIPIVDKALAPTEIYLGRSSVEDCLTFINEELDAVLKIEDDKAFPFIWDDSRRDRMSKSIALAMKMDINLQFKKYDIAKDAAQKLIASEMFELHYSTASDNSPEKNYRDLFRYIGETNKERILFKSSGCKAIWFRNMGTVLGGQGVTAPLKSMIDTYETIEGKTIQSLPESERVKFEKNPSYQPRDPRLNVTIILPEDNTSIPGYAYHPFDPSGSDFVGKTGASRSGYMMKKYLDLEDRSVGLNGTLDFMIYRYAEVLLDYVECLVETGDWQNSDVKKYINMIRKRAGMPEMDLSVYNTQEKVRELYRRERRVEFAFEGKRYDDIRRWGIGNETMQGTIFGAWNPNENSFVTIENRNCVFPKYDSWPIQQQEVTANPNINQPTGW